MITIHTDSAKEKCAPFVADQEIPYPVAVDGNDVIIKKYGVRAFPTYMIIGKDGKVFETDAWPADTLPAWIEKARQAAGPGDTDKPSEEER